MEDIRNNATIILSTGECIDTRLHQVQVELNEISASFVPFRDESHVTLIVDGELRALNNKFQISHEDPTGPIVFLRHCYSPTCMCKVTGPLIVKALLAETDITIHESLKLALLPVEYDL